MTTRNPPSARHRAVVVSLIAGIALSALADSPIETPLTYETTIWTVVGKARTEHTSSHGNPSEGKESLEVNVERAASPGYGTVAIYYEKNSEGKWVRKVGLRTQVKAWFEHTMEGNIAIEAAVIEPSDTLSYSDPNNPPANAPEYTLYSWGAKTEEPWKGSPRPKAAWGVFGFSMGAGGPGSIFARTHRPMDVAPEVKVPEAELSGQPSIVAHVTELDEGGDLQFVEDENGDVALDENGLPTLVVDVSGSVVWAEEPTTALRFSSSVHYNAQGGVVYKYVVENLTDYPRAFALNQVRTPTFPLGWTGSVAGNDTAETQYVVATAQDICTQNSQFDTETTDALHDNNGLGMRNCRPVLVYCPRTRLEYDGTNVLLSATFNPTTLRTTVTFRPMGAHAPRAVLYRKSGDDTWREVGTLTGPLVPGTDHEILDVDPPLVGVSHYLVQTGGTNNGYFSENAGEVVQ
jgi:hypothetical protein